MTNPRYSRGLLTLPSASVVVSTGTLAFALLSVPGPQVKKKPAPKPTVAKVTATFEKQGLPFIRKYCAPCHSADTAMAGIVVTKATTTAQVKSATEVWARVTQNLKTMHMPPKGSLLPTKAERDQMVKLLEKALIEDCGVASPGRVTLRRLNRQEYNNTIRDLVGLDLHLADDFPSDDVGYGFDNIGDVLTLSPLLMEKVMSAAEVIAQKAIVTPDARSKRYVATDMSEGSGHGIFEETSRVFSSQGRSDITLDLPTGGRYRVSIQAAAMQAGPELAKIGLWLNDKQVTAFDVSAVPGKSQAYQFTLPILKGPQKLGVSFLNDYYNPQAAAGQQDRNLIVEWIDLIGPLENQSPSDFQKKLIPGPPTDKLKDARRALTGFALRAYRRPATPEEADRLVEVFKVGEKIGGSYESGIQLGVQAILSSPHFLYKVETEPRASKATDRTLNGYELATRLSYFLWSTTPDDRLIALAGDGSLLKPEVLKSEVNRMLSDQRAVALADNFAGQWLQLRKLETTQPDTKTYTTYNDKLKQAMITETKRFFQHIVSADRPITDFIQAKYSFLNEDLAKLYGVPGVTGENFRKVSLESTPRRGVLTQASVLTVTSNPTHTSPVKRGKWVLENILGAPPPAPPPGVPQLSEDAKIITAASIRTRMEEHRKNPACANCHKSMDALGFSLENYDGVGAWRTQDGAFPVDASGELPDGSKFNGSSELSLILMKRKNEFVTALSDKMLTYALGRGITAADKCFVDEVAKKTTAQGDRFRALVTAVVLSEPFRHRAIERPQVKAK